MILPRQHAQAVLTSRQAYKAGKQATDICMAELEKINTTPEPVSINKCEAVLPAVLAGRDRKAENGTEYCTNIYDVRLEDTSPACGMNWPPDLAAVTPYLDRPDVQDAFHAGDAPVSWTECRGSVHLALQNKKSPSAVTLLPRVLARTQVLLFAGDQDFICNYVGIENIIHALQWNGVTGLGVRLVGAHARTSSLTRAADRGDAELVRERERGGDMGLRAQPDVREDLQREPHGRLRRPARRARHDAPLHGRRLLRARGRHREHPERGRRQPQAERRPRGGRREECGAACVDEDARAGQGDVGRCGGRAR
jgi:hypothetical protein